MRIRRLQGRRVVAVASVAAAGLLLSGCNPGSFAVGVLQPQGAWVNYKSATDNYGQNVVQIDARVVDAPDTWVAIQIVMPTPQSGPTPRCFDGEDLGREEACAYVGHVGGDLGSDIYIARTAAEKDVFWPMIKVIGDRRLHVTVACDPSPCSQAAKVELRARDVNTGAFIGDFQPAPPPV